MITDSCACVFVCLREINVEMNLQTEVRGRKEGTNCGARVCGDEGGDGAERGRSTVKL